MVTGPQLENRIRRFDRQLRHLENDAVKRLDAALKASAARLEREVRTRYLLALTDTADANAAFREARARVLLSQVRSLLTVTNGTPADNVFGQLIREAQRLGLENATEMLSAYQRQALALAANVPTDVLIHATNVSTRLVEIGNARVANNIARLAQHGEEAARKIEASIINGLVSGQGWSKTAREIRHEVGITRYSAERIVRTESITASHQARSEQYRENGVKYAQVAATADDRVCGYCANRAGRVYKLEDVHIPYHPNCRCFAMPWRPEWQELGLTDDDWNAEHRKETIERSEENQRIGPSPSERWQGLDKPPDPVWTP